MMNDMKYRINHVTIHGERHGAVHQIGPNGIQGSFMQLGQLVVCQI